MVVAAVVHDWLGPVQRIPVQCVTQRMVLVSTCICRWCHRRAGHAGIRARTGSLLARGSHGVMRVIRWPTNATSYDDGKAHADFAAIR